MCITILVLGFLYFNMKKIEIKYVKRIEMAMAPEMATKNFSVKSCVHSHQGSGCFRQFLILKVLFSSFQHFPFEFSVFYFRVLFSFSSSVNISSGQCKWSHILH